jgi:hypothetical protein
MKWGKPGFSFKIPKKTGQAMEITGSLNPS